MSAVALRIILQFAIFPKYTRIAPFLCEPFTHYLEFVVSIGELGGMSMTEPKIPNPATARMASFNPRHAIESTRSLRAPRLVAPQGRRWWLIFTLLGGGLGLAGLLLLTLGDRGAPTLQRSAADFTRHLKPAQAVAAPPQTPANWDSDNQMPIYGPARKTYETRNVRMQLVMPYTPPRIDGDNQ
jgi:hypothetical protein